MKIDTRYLSAPFKGKEVTYILLFGFSLLGWFTTSGFFWRDDWAYLLLYESGHYSLFHNHIGSDIKPLFQYFIFAEFFLFGKNFWLYLLVSIMLNAGCGLVLFNILKAIGIREKISFVGALFLILHPVQFVNVLWIFQQCELIHLLMVLMCTRIYIRILSDNQTKDHISFLLLLFFQHYFFPNGIFYSLAFAILSAFHFSTLRSYKLLWWCIAIFAFHVIQFFLLSQWLNENTTTTISIEIRTKLHFLLTFISNSIERFLIPNATLSNKFWMNILPLAIFVIIIWFGLKSVSQRKTFWSFIVLMISSSLTISIFRSGLSVIPFYYTSLHLPFIILLIAPIFDQLLFTMRSKPILFNIAAFSSIIILLWLDGLGKKIFTTRNNLNRLKMEEALLNGGPYFPFDDPALDLPSYITIDGKSSKETAVLLYRQFK